MFSDTSEECCDIRDFKPSSILSGVLERELSLETRQVPNSKNLTVISEFHTKLNEEPMCFMLQQTP